MSAPAFPIYQLMDAFEAFSHAELEVKPQHRSLYYFIIGYARRRGGLLKFSLPHESGMAGAGIGNWKTYNDAMLALHTWGFIVYTPGANRFKTPVVELHFRSSTDSSTDDQQLIYWQSYCTSIGSSTVDNKRLLDEETKRRQDVEKALSKSEEECASLRSALATAKVDLQNADAHAKQLEARNRELLAEKTAAENNASASRTRGAGRRRAEKPAPGSADLADYEAPPFASPMLRAKLAAWLQTRQTRNDCQPLQAKAIQARLDELARYDEAFCLNLLEKAEQNPQWQGLTFQDTPIKFAQYLQAKEHHAQRNNSTGYGGGFNRSGAGAKPDLRAGQMAAAAAYAPGDTSGLPWGQSGSAPH